MGGRLTPVKWNSLALRRFHAAINLSGILEFDGDPEFEMLGEDLALELEDGRRLRIMIKSLGKQAEFRVSDAGDLKAEI